MREGWCGPGKFSFTRFFRKKKFAKFSEFNFLVVVGDSANSQRVRLIVTMSLLLPRVTYEGGMI
jgi:hypothetical protein